MIPTNIFDSSHPIIFSSDSQKLIILTDDGIVTWDLETKESIIRYEVKAADVVYSSDRKKIALLSFERRNIKIGNSLDDFKNMIT